MVDRRRARSSGRLGAAAVSLAVAVLLLVPVPSLPEGSEWTMQGVPLDKLAHVALFILQGIAWARALGVSEGRAARTFFVLLLSLTVFGALLELAQGAIGWRMAELADVLADALGAALGLGFWVFGQPAVTEPR